MEKHYKILATMHDRVPYWLVFDGMEIVYKGETKEDADNFIHTALRTKKSH